MLAAEVRSRYGPQLHSPCSAHDNVMVDGGPKTCRSMTKQGVRFLSSWILMHVWTLIGKSWQTSHMSPPLASNVERTTLSHCCWDVAMRRSPSAAGKPSLSNQTLRLLQAVLSIEPRCAWASDGVSATLVSLVSLVTFATLNRTRTSSSAPCPRSSPCRDQSQTPPRTWTSSWWATEQRLSTESWACRWPWCWLNCRGTSRPYSWW